MQIASHIPKLETASQLKGKQSGIPQIMEAIKAWDCCTPLSKHHIKKVQLEKGRLYRLLRSIFKKIHRKSYDHLANDYTQFNSFAPGAKARSSSADLRIDLKKIYMETHKTSPLGSPIIDHIAASARISPSSFLPADYLQE